MKYDIQNILDAGSGRMAFVIKILTLFVGDVDTKIEAFKNAISNKNYKEIEDHAHQLKTNLRLLSKEALAEKAEYIEKKAAQKKCDAKCFEYLDALMKELEVLKKTIKMDLDNGKYK